MCALVAKPILENAVEVCKLKTIRPKKKSENNIYVIMWMRINAYVYLCV